MPILEIEPSANGCLVCHTVLIALHRTLSRDYFEHIQVSNEFTWKHCRYIWIWTRPPRHTHTHKCKHMATESILPSVHVAADSHVLLILIIKVNHHTHTYAQGAENITPRYINSWRPAPAPCTLNTSLSFMTGWFILRHWLFVPKSCWCKQIYVPYILTSTRLHTHTLTALMYAPSCQWLLVSDSKSTSLARKSMRGSVAPFPPGHSPAVHVSQCLVLCHCKPLCAPCFVQCSTPYQLFSRLTL